MNIVTTQLSHDNLKVEPPVFEKWMSQLEGYAVAYGATAQAATGNLIRNNLALMGLTLIVNALPPLPPEPAPEVPPVPPTPPQVPPGPAEQPSADAGGSALPAPETGSQPQS